MSSSSRGTIPAKTLGPGMLERISSGRIGLQRLHINCRCNRTDFVSVSLAPTNGHSITLGFQHQTDYNQKSVMRAGSGGGRAVGGRGGRGC